MCATPNPLCIQGKVDPGLGDDAAFSDKFKKDVHYSETNLAQRVEDFQRCVCVCVCV